MFSANGPGCPLSQQHRLPVPINVCGQVGCSVGKRGAWQWVSVPQIQLCQGEADGGTQPGAMSTGSKAEAPPPESGDPSRSGNVISEPGICHNAALSGLDLERTWPWGQKLPERSCFPHSGASASALGDTREANVGSAWSLRHRPQGSPPGGPWSPPSPRGKWAFLPLSTAGSTPQSPEGSFCNQRPTVHWALGPPGGGPDYPAHPVPHQEQ